MILEPVNDRECLGQLVARARELARTRIAYDVAARLRSTRNVVAYLQGLPQLDDDGTERVQVIACDVNQRLRFLPSDPNCFERTLAGLVLLEVIDPQTERVPVSVDEPERHTGIVERAPGGAWQAVDLFPRRRNAAGRRRSRNTDDKRRVASIIVKQLGTVALAMLGAYDLVAWPDGLQFGIKGSPEKITRVGILLAPDDTYTVEFYRGRGINITKAAEYESVYVDQLHELIESETGLNTTMARRQAVPRSRRRVRNSTAQDVMGYVHPVGDAVMSIFGLGGVANELGKLEQQHGLLKRPEQRTHYGQPAPAPPASSPASASRSPQRDPELASASRRAPDARQPISESGGPEHGDEESTPTTQNAPSASRGAPPFGGPAGSAPRDEEEAQRGRVFL